jgi:4a-hydroxytetrahydrobiopterin dehydratase
MHKNTRWRSNMTDLSQKRCLPCEGIGTTLDKERAHELLANISGWQLSQDGKIIWQDFKFKGFYKTMAFVNAVAWIANQENHHPDLEVGYDHCLVRFTTHALNGLTENDFIAAAKVDALLKT